jgi:hypothetical protein
MLLDLEEEAELLQVRDDPVASGFAVSPRRDRRSR